MLVTSFLMQGARFVYADETAPLGDAQTTTETVPDDTQETISTEESEVIDETEPIVTEGDTQEDVVEEGLIPSDQLEPIEEGVVTSTTSVATSTDTSEYDPATSNPGEPAAGEPSVPDEDSTPPPETIDNSLDPDSTPSDPPEADDDTGDSEQNLSNSDYSTTSSEVGLDVDSSTTTGGFTAYVESDSAFSFDKNECTKLASGSFYCQEAPKDIPKDALFAAPDADGDTEIYFVKDGVQSQVTNNLTDDAAPYYDNNSDTIVWHRLLDDRYQIISYDVDSGEETVLTNTEENNMEPTRQGKYTVWQRWVNGGWNIILHDGKSEQQITRTSSHNVAPYIHGTLVVWNRHNISGEKTIEMYDIINQTYVTINDSEGMSVSNPRMVFVYDSLNASGDIVTRGYDILAKRFIDLDTLPRPIPDQIPESESTGETRALIQNKPTQKSEVEESLEGDMLPEPDPALDPNQVSTSTLISEQPVLPTLDLRVDSATTTVLQVEEITAYDIVIPPFSSSTEPVNE